METARLPFCINRIYAGCAKIDGFVIIGPDHLNFEYRMSDNLLGAWAGKITTKTVSMSDLQSVEYRLGFFTPSLILTARTLVAFDKLPTDDGSTLRVRVPWKYRHQLRAMTSEINLSLSYREADRHRHRLSNR